MSSIVTCPGCGARNRVPDAAAGAPRCPRCKTPLPWVVDATPGQFDRLVEGPLPVLVDFWAPWCGPCRMVGPAVEAAAAELAGTLKVVRVNVDDLPDVAARNGVQGIPTLILLRSGAVADRQVGAVPKPALMQWLRSQLDARVA
jgi:thioredoxin 2